MFFLNKHPPPKALTGDMATDDVAKYHAQLSPKDLSISTDITDYGIDMPRTARPLRYPRLDTVLMVERSIKKYDGEFKKRQLWEHLPKKMMYQTFCVVIDYLLYSGKISIDSEGKIGWIFYPKETAQRLKYKNLFWRKRPRSRRKFSSWTGGLKKP